VVRGGRVFLVRGQAKFDTIIAACHSYLIAAMTG
jgi:hypothetical protein